MATEAWEPAVALNTMRDTQVEVDFVTKSNPDDDGWVSLGKRCNVMIDYNITLTQ